MANKWPAWLAVSSYLLAKAGYWLAYQATSKYQHAGLSLRLAQWLASCLVAGWLAKLRMQCLPALASSNENVAKYLRKQWLHNIIK